MSESIGARLHDSRYGFGVTCLLTATLFTSLAGILLRLMDHTDGWQILFYRSVCLIVVLLAWLIYRHGRNTAAAFRAVGRPGQVVAVALSLSFVTFILAMLQTTVANVVFVNGGTPLFAALFGWLALREPVRRVIWFAMAAAFCGIAIMVSGGIARGNMQGNLLALVCSLSFAVTLVAMRRGKAVDMLPAICLAGLVTMVISAAMTESFAISLHDLVLVLTLGVVQLGLQYILVTTGARYVPAAEIALIGRTVIVLAPLWVWIGVGEVPTGETLIGGAIVLLAVVGQAFWSLRPSARLSSP